MGKFVVVEGDPVAGADTHNVSGMTAVPAPYVGTADFSYVGAITGQLSDFVRIDGVAVALVSSRSSLNEGEEAPGGKHFGTSGSNFQPSDVDLTKPVQIMDKPLGTGAPGAGAGSGLLTVNGVEVLLDADPIDTCGGSGSVTASGQDFVSCSE
jgi:hypothetical protein